MCMPLHLCVWMSVCVFVNEHGCIMSGQPLLNINNPFSISPLAFCPLPPPPPPPHHPPLPSSLLISQPSVWPVFKRLQAPMKLDWVQCNEEHAREEYDIKCCTKHAPHIRHTHKDTQTRVLLTKSNIKTHRQTCESFGRKTKSLFVNPFTILTD